MKRYRSSILLVGCLALCYSHVTLAKEIKIAIVGPMSGPVAQYGDMEFVGSEHAIRAINDSGGVNGDRLVGIKYDDACDPKQAVAVANKVVNDGINYVIGHLCSSSTQPASDIYDDEGILMITPAATNEDLTTRGYQLVLRTTGLDSDQAPTAANYVINTVKPERIAIIHDKQQYGEGIARVFRDVIIKAGIKPVLFEGVTAGDKDFASLISRLKRERVDFVYFGGYYPEMGLLLRQSRQAGLAAKFMGPEGVGNVSLSNIAGEASEGILVTLPRRYDQQPENSEIVDSMKQNRKDPTGPFIWTTYAAIQSLAEGMKKSNSRDPKAIAEALKSAGADTVMGALHWDKKGDLSGFEFGVFEWHADGSSTQRQ